MEKLLCNLKCIIPVFDKYLLLSIVFLFGSTTVSAQDTTKYFAKIPRFVQMKAENPELKRIQYEVIFTSKITSAEKNAIIEHMKDPKNYIFTPTWPKLKGLEEIKTPNPAFVLKNASFVEESPISQEGTIGLIFRLTGVAADRNRGTVMIKPLQNWQFVLQNDPENTQVDGFMYASSQGLTLPRFTPDPIRLSVGENTFLLEYKGEGLLNQPKTDTVENAKKPLMFSEVMVKYPVNIPRDVKNVIGANKDASGVVADIIQVGVKSLQYKQNGGLQETGGRFRVSGTGKGAELVGYYSPASQLSINGRQFYALEFEAGLRQGDAEWKNLTTRAPNTGHLVARAGAVLEWAPEIRGTGINRDLTPSAPGLKFFIRDRFWLDSIKEGKEWRGRGYLDSELFYNFTNKSRLYLRYESGYSLPDLSRYVQRVSLGVGKAF
jgi:hypothetical protein